jgi:hypothetical protein
VSGAVSIFDRALVLPENSWQTAPDTGSAWSDQDWWLVDIRSESRTADVKWTWELGRHRHLVILARAWHLENDEAYSLLLNDELVSWLDGNPLEHGVHWYSNLELALRALSWLEILGLARRALPDSTVRRMGQHLWHTGRHITADLPYTASSMRNNHLLGDALGLIAIGRAFREHRLARMWSSLGERLFNGQLTRHMHADGSMIEDSVSYHRFVLEMLAVRVRLGDAPPTVRHALRAASQFLCRLGAFDGPIPQYGDWDAGRVVASSGDAHDLAGAAALGLALSGSGAPTDWRGRFDECAWYGGRGQPVVPDKAERGGGPCGGGIGRVEHASWTAWLKVGSAPSHQHADLSSVTIQRRGQLLVGDPGTGAYNGPLEQRNAFRVSAAHNGLRVDGEDQLVPHRAFRWLKSASGAVGTPLDIGDGLVMWGVHDAYRRLTPSRYVTRAVVALDQAIHVIDCIEGPGSPWDLTLALPPGVKYSSGHIVIDGDTLALDVDAPVSVVQGQREPFAGWWSPTYGDIRATQWLQASGHSSLTAWSIREPTAVPTIVEGSRVRVGRHIVAFEWAEDAVTILVDGPRPGVSTIRLAC